MSGAAKRALAGPALITLCLKSTLPSRAGSGALVLRVFCGRTVSAARGPGLASPPAA